MEEVRYHFTVLAANFHTSFRASPLTLYVGSENNARVTRTSQRLLISLKTIENLLWSARSYVWRVTVSSLAIPTQITFIDEHLSELARHQSLL